MTVDVEDLKRRHAIADVVRGHGVELRRQGAHLAGLCPFHADGRASLIVYPETRSFYCFGCGAGGDVIDFVRRVAGLGFREAVARLEGGAAPEVTPVREAPGLSVDDRVMLAAACELYHEVLLRSPVALEYLERRGIAARTVRRFRLGYSDGAVLVPYLRRRRLSVHRARELGLLGRGDREAMAERLVVPELRAGRCAWMVGRSLAEREPRYRGLALPRPLLGWELIRDRARIFVTEGPFDWLTLAGWGLPACALLGTQPASSIRRVLGRARSVVLVLDADEAGRAAAEQLAAALEGRAVILPLPAGAKDVNELASRPDGREEFFRLLREREGVPDAATE